MKLVGKKITRVSKQDLNTKAELVVDPVKGNMKISSYGLRKLDLADKYLGFAYDDDENAEASKVYLYTVDGDDGVKIGKSGTLNSRWHSRELRDRFNEGSIEKFTLVIDTIVHNDPDHENVVFHQITWNDKTDLVITKAINLEKDSVDIEAFADQEPTHNPNKPAHIESDDFVQEEAWAHEEEKDEIDF